MKKPINWPMPVVVLLTVGGLSFTFYRILTPEAYLSPPSSPISYVYYPDESGRADKAHVVTGMFWSADSRGIDVTLHYRAGDAEPFEELPMDRVRGTKVFVGSIPGREMGKRSFYYIRAVDSHRNEVRIPPTAPEKPLLYVTFRGDTRLPALIAHIVLTFGALFLLTHALYYALRILGGLALKKEEGRCISNVLAGWIAFAVSTIPLGIYISISTLGEGWSGWPVGHDITDTKSLVLVIFWGIPAVLYWSRRTSKRALSWLVVAGAVLTALVYLIPHSYFFQ